MRGAEQLHGGVGSGDDQGARTVSLQQQSWLPPPHQGRVQFAAPVSQPPLRVIHLRPRAPLHHRRRLCCAVRGHRGGAPRAHRGPPVPPGRRHHRRLGRPPSGPVGRRRLQHVHRGSCAGEAGGVQHPAGQAGANRAGVLRHGAGDSRERAPCAAVCIAPAEAAGSHQRGAGARQHPPGPPPRGGDRQAPPARCRCGRRLHRGAQLQLRHRLIAQDVRAAPRLDARHRHRFGEGAALRL